MGYFRLLQGIHQEPGRQTFQVTEEKDDKGEVIAVNQPVIESDLDLVILFGSGKFERVPDPPKTLLNVTGGTGVAPAPAPQPSPVAQAAAQGAVAVAEPPNYGKDVTRRFPAAVENTIRVFMKPGGKYTLVDPETEPPTVINPDGVTYKRSDVAGAIETYLES